MTSIFRIGIVGAGGFGRETLCNLIESDESIRKSPNDFVCFLVDDNFYDTAQILGVDVFRMSQFDPKSLNVVSAIGDSKRRSEMIERLPKSTNFTRIVHKSVFMSEWVHIGLGSIISAGSILTCNIKLGMHCHLNLQTTIGHDCDIGDFFTTAPGVRISGNCTIGNRVYIGTGALIREGIKICDDVVIGMGSVVVKNISEPGIYVGNPCRKLDKI